MTEILNELSETVYIADTETYELLFLNTAGRKFFSIDSDYKGKKCYEVLQHKTEPCPFCTNSKLSANHVCEWEIFNPVANRYYLLKDKLINWNGDKLVRMEIALDITDIQNKQAEIEKASQMEQFIRESLRLLHRSKSLQENIDDLLAALGNFLQAERTYIFDIDIVNKYTSNTYEWCAPGITAEIDNLQQVPLTAINRWIPFFMRNEYVYIEDIENIKHLAVEEYEVLARQGIRSLVVVPLMTEQGELMGYIGVDNPSIGFSPQSIDVLYRALSFFLVSILTKNMIEKELKDMSFKDMLTGLQNSNKFTCDLKIIQKNHTKEVGIAYVDMNGLKEINDTFGHEKGNEALRTIAQRLSQVFRRENLYRIGGDEFVIICTDIPQKVFDEKIQSLTNIATWKNPQSIAIGHLWFKQITDINEHLKDTDALMYANKKKYYQECGKIPRRTISAVS